MSVDSILLAGRFNASALEQSFKRAFDAIGVQTHCFDFRASRTELGWLLRNRWTHRLTIRSGRIREKSFRAFSRLFEESVLRSGARVVFIVSLEFVLPETLRNLRRQGVRVVFFYPDNPFQPAPTARPETIPAAQESDLCLIYSEVLAHKLKDAGVPNPVFLPFGWDPEAFPYQNDQPQGSWPGVVFIGTWDRHRERFLEKLARHVPLRIYGEGYWGTRTMPFSRARRCWQGRPLFLGDAARAMRQSAVCLNILRPQHIIDGVPDGLIMRHLEVPGAGGFLLSTRGGGATTIFPEGETAEYYSGVDECIEKIDKYLTNESGRRELVERAHAAVASHHTYIDRVQQILRLLDKRQGKASA